MNNYLEKIASWLFYLFIFLLPWQTRWIWHHGLLAGGNWEYGTFSLYGIDILFVVLLVLCLFLPRSKQPGVQRFWVPVGAFFLICFVSIFSAGNRELAWYGILKLAEGILVFWIVLRAPLSWKKVGLAIVASGVIQAVLGIWQFFSQRVIASKWLGMAAHDPGALGDFVVETSSGRWLRVYGSLPHPNILAGFLVVCLLILIGFILVEHRERRGRLLVVISYSVAFAVMFFGLILTFSRSAWLAFAVALLVMFGISALFRDRYRLFALVRVYIWIILLVIFSVVMLPNLWQTRVVSGGRLEAMSSSQRISYYEEAWGMIEQNWLQGIGINNYTHALYNQGSLKDVWEYQPVHNVFVLVAAEVGVFGGLIFILLAFEFMRSSVDVIKRKKERVDDWFLIYTMIFVALLVIGLFDHYLWTLSFGILLFWLILGLWTRKWLEEAHGGFINTLVDKLFH